MANKDMAQNFDAKITIGKKVQTLSDKLKDLNLLMIGIVVVLFVGFAGMFVATSALLIESFNSKTVAYEELVKNVNQQNTQLDLITTALKKLKIIQ
jgi:hypothetical protein